MKHPDNSKILTHIRQPGSAPVIPCNTENTIQMQSLIKTITQNLSKKHAHRRLVHEILNITEYHTRSNTGLRTSMIHYQPLHMNNALIAVGVIFHF